jgi:hypothetical protein
MEWLGILCYLPVILLHGWIGQKFLQTPFWLGCVLGFFCPGFALFIMFFINHFKNQNSGG